MFVIMESLSAMKKKKEEEEKEQEVEGEKEENAQTTMRMSMDGMTMEDKCETAGANVKCEWIQTTHLRTACSVLNAAICASLRASRHSRCCSQCAHLC